MVSGEGDCFVSEIRIYCRGSGFMVVQVMKCDLFYDLFQGSESYVQGFLDFFRGEVHFAESSS
jgi:hypothetical protein